MNINRSLKVETASRTRPLVDAYEVLTRRAQEQLRRLTVDNFSEGLAMEVRDEVEKISIRMSFLAVRWLRRAMPAIYREARGIAAKNAASVGYKPTSPADHAVVLARRQDATLAFLDEAASSLRTFTAQYIDAVREALLAMKNLPAKAEEFDFKQIVGEIIYQTIRAKQSVWFAKSKILERLNDIVSHASFVYVNGRNYDIRYYTDMVARTELAKAFTDATTEALKEYGDDLVEFSDSAMSCETCKQFGGRIFSLSGKHPKYPPLPAEAKIPVHPNCGCALLPVADWGN